MFRTTYPIVGTLVFQGKTSLSGELDQTELLTLKSEAFPRFLPGEFRSRPGFEAFKIFGSSGRHIVVSYVSDSGENDEWNRPLVRADVAVFDEVSFDDAGRDVIAIRDSLREARSRRLPFPEMSVLIGENVRNSVLGSGALLQRFLDRLGSAYGDDTKFLSDSLSAFLTDGKLILVTRDREVLSNLLRFVFLCLPFSRALKSLLTNVCTSPLEEGAENTLVLPSFDQGGILGRFRSGSRVINSDKRAFVGDLDPEARGFAEVMVKGLLARPWYSFDRLEQYRLTVGLFEAFASGGGTPSLENGKIASMRETLADIDELLGGLGSIRGGRIKLEEGTKGGSGKNWP